jgi:DNA-binding GntR family transcriptional regulator
VKVNKKGDLMAKPSPESDPDPTPGNQFTAASQVIETRGLADEIAFRLEAAIISRELPPGTRLGQEELCRRFGVSRTPIREALRKLQAQRLITLIPNKGATVRLPTRKEIEEVYDLRGELEAFAAELAARRSQPSIDAELSRAVDLLRRSRRADSVQAINDSAINIEISGAIRNFHHIIHRAAGNDRLISVLRELETFFPGNYCSHEMTRPLESRKLHIDDHERIHKAILDRDAAAARAVMKEHVERSKGMLLRHLDEQRVWRQLATDGQKAPSTHKSSRSR